MEMHGGPAPAAKAVWLDRTTPPHVVTLVLMTGVAALNINMVLPSLPSIAAHYDADYGVAALAISAYLGLTALLQLVIGPLSDRFGRRPVLLGCFAVFLAATVGCILAPSIEVFLGFRLLQATVAVGLRAQPGDRARHGADRPGGEPDRLRHHGHVADADGRADDRRLPRRELRLAGGVRLHLRVRRWSALALIWADLGETNLAPSASFAAQFRAYPELLRSRRFWGYSATAALASGAFFAFLGGGPWVASEVLGMSPSQLGFHFGFIAVGYMVGNFVSGRYAGGVGLNRMMLVGRDRRHRRDRCSRWRSSLAGVVDSARASSARSSSSGSATASCCRAPMPASSRCGRTSPAPPRVSAAR